MNDKWLPDGFEELSRKDDILFGYIDTEDTEKTIDDTFELYRRVYKLYFVNESGKCSTKSPTGIPQFSWGYAKTGIPEGNIPFTIQKSFVRVCAFGKGRPKPIKVENSDEYQLIKKRKTSRSRKLGCLAKWRVQVLARYIDYTLSRPILYRDERKTAALKRLRLGEYKTAKVQFRIYMRIPLPGAHTQHETGPDCPWMPRINNEIISSIHAYVNAGIVSPTEIQTLLKNDVDRICRNHSIKPDQDDEAFYPSKKTIQNHIHSGMVSNQYSNIDLDNLEQLIIQWQLDPSKIKEAHRYFLQKPKDLPYGQVIRKDLTSESTATVSSEKYWNDEEEVLENDKESRDKFIFVHQNKFQRQILHRYGNLCLLDAAYKKNKYVVPLYFLVVRTNIGYIPVAEFLIEDETTTMIEYALQILKKWMEEDGLEWKPQYFLTDYDVPKQQAIKNAFPSVEEIFLCSFHTEQIWKKFVSKGSNDLNKLEQETWIAMMRSIATAETKDVLSVAVKNMRTSNIYIKNTLVRNYTERYWLNNASRWCMCCQSMDFYTCITTNNGIEALNNVFKNVYCKLFSMGTLSAGIDNLIHKFISEKIAGFGKNNIIQSRMFLKTKSSYNKLFMGHAYPANVKKLFEENYASSAVIGVENISEISPRTFVIKGESSENVLCFGTDTTVVYCDCSDFKRKHLLCKHFMAVFRHTKYTLNDIHNAYLHSPYLTLQPYFLRLSHDHAEAIYVDSTNLGNESLVYSNDTEESHLNDSILPQIAKEPTPDVEKMKNIRLEYIDTLKSMIDMCYNINELDPFLENYNVLKRLYESMKASVPTYQNLSIESQPVQLYEQNVGANEEICVWFSEPMMK